MFLLKGPHTDLLTDGLTCSEPQSWDSSLKAARDKQKGIELSDLRARAGGAAFSQTEVLEEAIVPLLSPPTIQHIDTGECHI